MATKILVLWRSSAILLAVLFAVAVAFTYKDLGYLFQYGRWVDSQFPQSESVFNYSVNLGLMVSVAPLLVALAGVILAYVSSIYINYWQLLRYLLVWSILVFAFSLFAIIYVGMFSFEMISTTDVSHLTVMTGWWTMFIICFIVGLSSLFGSILLLTSAFALRKRALQAIVAD